MFKNPLIQFAGIPVSSSDIKSCFPDLASPDKKIQTLEKQGELIRLKRNLYIVSKELTGKDTDTRLCANHIYGPSYVSIQWALRYYGMIPEQVFRMTCITTKHSRSFKTPIGEFSYMQVPDNYFPIGVETVEENGVSFLMASREKALCDTILSDPYVPNLSVIALRRYLEDDIRFDMDELTNFNLEIIRECAECGRKKNTLLNLIKIIEQLDILLSKALKYMLVKQKEKIKKDFCIFTEYFHT